MTISRQLSAGRNCRVVASPPLCVCECVCMCVGLQLMCLLACTANERGYAILSKRIRRVCPPVAARQVEQMSQRQNSQLDGNNNSNNQINNDALNLYPPVNCLSPLSLSLCGLFCLRIYLVVMSSVHRFAFVRHYILVLALLRLN